MNSPLLSVCLVTYNHEELIGKALEGAVRQQTSFPFEIVIGEDCSTDGTRAICEIYAQQYPDIVRLLPSQKNMGLNANMLRTFRQCRGQYIAYLEGDDHWVTTDKLQKQVDVLETQPDVVLVHTNCHVWQVKTDYYWKRIIDFEGECIREKQYGIDSVIAEYKGPFRPIKTSTCVYRKSVMEQILLEDEYAYANKEFPTQDFQLFQDMSFRGKFAFVDEVTTIIGLVDSISANEDPEKKFNFREGFDKIGTYYIQKYCLQPIHFQGWYKNEFHWLLNFAMHHPQFADRALARLSVAEQLGYETPKLQRMLSCVLRNKWLHIIIKPIYNIYYKSRG